LANEWINYAAEITSCGELVRDAETKEELRKEAQQLSIKH